MENGLEPEGLTEPVEPVQTQLQLPLQPEPQPEPEPEPESKMVEPITLLQRQQVELQTEQYICLAEALYDRSFDRIPVLFDLKGHTVGMFKMIGEQRMIRYNPWIFSKHFTENLRDTVPHEVAHYIVHEVYHGRSGKPHGPRWQRVMARFDADPGVTFNLDLEGVPHRQQKTHPYWCGCQPHEVSSTRHNRIERGVGRYYCRSCKGELVYCAPDTAS